MVNFMLAFIHHTTMESNHSGMSGMCGTPSQWCRNASINSTPTKQQDNQNGIQQADKSSNYRHGTNMDIMDVNYSGNRKHKIH